MKDSVRAFLRIVQGLFAAALLFQGMEYLQHPNYVTIDMPTLYRLDPDKMPNKDVPLAAQAPALRFLPSAIDETNAPPDPAEAEANGAPPDAVSTNGAAPAAAAPGGVDAVEKPDAEPQSSSGADRLDLVRRVVPWIFAGLGLLVLVMPLSWFIWVFRLSLAALFIYAGLLKIKNPPTFAQNIACYMQAPSEWINAIAFIMPWVEVLAGIALLLPFARHAGAFLIFALLCGFLYSTGTALWQGLDISCGCGIEPKPLEWSKLAKNTIYALGCVGVLLYRPDDYD